MERLREEVPRAAYRLPEADPQLLEAIAEGWRPCRDWVALLLDSDRERRTGESRASQ
jgi:hypothetical protein